MAIGRDTMTLRDKFSALEAYTEHLKKDFEEYITSPVHSLELRWAMFRDAPAVLSNHDKFIYHGWDKILNPENPKSRVNWINDLDWAEHGETLEVVDTVETVFKNPESYELNYSGLDDPGFLDKIKEQVLKDNIKSFKYAW